MHRFPFVVHPAKLSNQDQTKTPRIAYSNWKTTGNPLKEATPNEGKQQNQKLLNTSGSNIITASGWIIRKIKERAFIGQHGTLIQSESVLIFQKT